MMVPVRGAELYYSTRGNGPACLVLSAIGTEPYRRLTPQLSEHLTLVYVDLRGVGDSGHQPFFEEPDRFATTLIERMGP